MVAKRAGERMKRARQKQQTHQRIVDVASRRFREEGLSGTGVQRIMGEAGLTHGGFYSHFGSKAELIAEAVADAAKKGRAQWIAGVDELPGPRRLAHLVSRYLSPAHRDLPGVGCPLPSTSADVARAPDFVRDAYGDGLRTIIEGLEADLGGAEDEESHATAVGTLALCVGGLLLARAVKDPAFSDDILESCRQFGGGRGKKRKA